MRIPAALVIGLFGVTAWGQSPGQLTGTQQRGLAGSSLSFEAKAVSTGATTKLHNTGQPAFNHESPTGEQTRMIRLEVRVRNFGTTPAQAHLDCYFLATKLPRAKRFIWDTVGRDVVVDAGAEKAETMESTQLTTAQTFSGSTGFDASGNLSVSNTEDKVATSKVYGWIVRLMSGDRVLKVQASSSELESIARDPAMIAKLRNRR